MSKAVGFHIDVKPVSVKLLARTVAEKSRFRGENSMSLSAGVTTGATSNAPTAKWR